MEIPKLQKWMQKERLFLANVYKGNGMQVRTELSAASNLQLRLLITVLHKISVGSIHLGKSQFASIQRAKKATFLTKQFGTKANTNRLLRSSRKDQLEVLNRLASSFNHLLFRFVI